MAHARARAKMFHGVRETNVQRGMNTLLRKAFIAALLLFQIFDAIAQLRCLNCTGRDTTRYTNGMENDSLFFICMGETASLQVSSPDNQSLNFQWYRYINATNSWQTTVYAPAVAFSSYNATLGGFRVVGTDSSGVVRLEEICWVSRINQAPIINGNTLQPGCTNLTLSAVYFQSNITGYYNPPPSNPELPYMLNESSEISICLDISHPIMSDLSIELVAPEACGGVSVVLTPAQIGADQDTACINSDALDLCFTTESSASFDLCSLPNYQVTGQFGAYGNPAVPIDWSVLNGCQANQDGWQLVIGDCVGGADGVIQSAVMHVSGIGADLLTAQVDLALTSDDPVPITDDNCSSGLLTEIALELQPYSPQLILNAFTVNWIADPPFPGVNGSSQQTIYLTQGPTTDTEFTVELLGPNLNGACGAYMQDVEFYDYIQPDSTVISYTDSVLCVSDAPMLLTSSIGEGVWNGPGEIVDEGVWLDPASLGVGEWVVSFQPNSSCIDSSSVTILIDQPPVVSITSSSIFCETDPQVLLQGQPLGGFWRGEAILDSLSGLFDPALVGGDVASVIYTSVGNCPAADTLIVSVETVVEASIIEPDTIVCLSDAPINFDANLSPGFWLGPGISGAAQGLFEPELAGLGTHTITYNYTGVCESSATRIVTVEDPSISFTQPTAVCLDSDPVNLEVFASEGTWSGLGIIDLEEGVVDPSMLQTGTHYFTYTLSNSCAAQDSIGLTIEDFPSIVIDLPQGICVSQNAFTLLANLPGGTYDGQGVQQAGNQWQFDPALSGSGTAVIRYDYSGVCTVSVYDSLAVYPLPELTVSGDTSICPDGQAQLQVSGAFQYGWSPASALTEPTIASPLATPEETTTFLVSGESEEGCFSTAEVTVTVYDSPLTSANSPVELCPGETGVLEVEGLSSAVWEGAGIENPTALSTLVTPDSSSLYTVQGLDENGCVGQAQVEVIVYEPMAAFEASDTTGIPPLEVVFTNLSEGDYFVWIMGNGDTIITTSLAETVSSIYAGEYTYDVTLMAYWNGCSDTFTEEITTYYDSEFLIIPNVVTMGGNGDNDTWRVITRNMDELEAIIFDRWGKKVGELKRPDAQWNPKNSGTGTYFYTLHALGLDGEEYNFEGSFTVLEDE
jgi:gliding motility-associated-like protein